MKPRNILAAKLQICEILKLNNKFGYELEINNF